VEKRDSTACYSEAAGEIIGADQRVQLLMDQARHLLVRDRMIGPAGIKTGRV